MTDVKHLEKGGKREPTVWNIEYLPGRRLNEGDEPVVPAALGKRTDVKFVHW